MIDVENLGDDEFLTSQAKNCGDPKSAQQVLSFKLYNYHQPVLTRNMLVLIKAGFFDDRVLFPYRGVNQLPAIGMQTSAWDPFVYGVDGRYGHRTTTVATAADQQTLSSFYREPGIGRNIKPVPDLLGASVQSPAGVDLTRQILPLRTIFVDSDLPMIGQVDGLAKRKELPVAFGELVTPFPNSIKDVGALVQEKGLRVVCAAIDVPEVSKYIVGEKSCPKVANEPVVR